MIAHQSEPEFLRKATKSSTYYFYKLFLTPTTIFFLNHTINKLIATFLLYCNRYESIIVLRLQKCVS